MSGCCSRPEKLNAQSRLCAALPRRSRWRALVRAGLCRGVSDTARRPIASVSSAIPRPSVAETGSTSPAAPRRAERASRAMHLSVSTRSLRERPRCAGPPLSSPCEHPGPTERGRRRRQSRLRGRRLHVRRDRAAHELRRCPEGAEPCRRTGQAPLRCHGWFLGVP